MANVAQTQQQRAGKDSPRNYADFLGWFPDDAACLGYLAVEQANKGFGRCRLQLIPNAESETLRSFLLATVEPGATILTDGLPAYLRAAGADYAHHATPIKGSGMDAHEILPGEHRIASLVKRWLLGTHQSSIGADHLQAYLDEFTFRFNRRGSKARGMLFYRPIEQSIGANPVSFHDLVAPPTRETPARIIRFLPSCGKQRHRRFMEHWCIFLGEGDRRICMDTPLYILNGPAFIACTGVLTSSRCIITTTQNTTNSPIPDRQLRIGDTNP